MNQQIRAVYELEKILIKRLGDNLDILPFPSKVGIIEGNYKNVVFNILFEKDRYLILSVSNTGRSLLNILSPILSEIMNEGPLCSYDFQKENHSITPTMEWNVDDPEKRINELINEYPFENNIKVSNIVLYTKDEIDYRPNIVKNKVIELKKQS